MNIQLHLTNQNWQEKADGKLKQRGTCWSEPEQLLQLRFSTDICEVLRRQNGFYALVWEQDDKFYAAVDHIRSIPLFYASKDDDFFLSDNAEWVRKQVKNEVMDETAKEEFLLTGYVTGHDTLYPDVKQIQSGEFLSVSTNTNAPLLQTERYYRFLHSEPEIYDVQALYKQLDAAALTSIDNLIQYANGRQIVIPLSGGYDSRLIATLLKRRGYENVFTFTYGIVGNKESIYSKKVANALGFKWHFVEYNYEYWRNAWETPTRHEFQQSASNWSSLAHFQDWLAVKILKEEHIIEKDCVFSPGHSLDFLAGSHIPSVAFFKKDLNLQDVISEIFSKHYSLNSDSCYINNIEKWSERIKNAIKSEDFCSNIVFADRFEKWDWQERQAKYICNSVRVYDFFGYDWWLPLWDKEIVEFWLTVPLSLRKERYWCINYIQDLFSNYDDVNSNLENANEPSNFIKMAKKTPFFKITFLRFFIKKLYLSLFSKRNPLAFDGWFDKQELEIIKNKSICHLGMLSSKFIKENDRS